MSHLVTVHDVTQSDHSHIHIIYGYNLLFCQLLPSTIKNIHKYSYAAWTMMVKFTELNNKLFLTFEILLLFPAKRAFKCIWFACIVMTRGSGP